MHDVRRAIPAGWVDGVDGLLFEAISFFGDIYEL
jgi:hypothetical protein